VVFDSARWGQAWHLPHSLRFMGTNQNLKEGTIPKVNTKIKVIMKSFIFSKNIKF
jgi:hypothetical protein